VIRRSLLPTSSGYFYTEDGATLPLSRMSSWRGATMSVEGDFELVALNVIKIQSDSKLLSGFPWHINGNSDNNLESPVYRDICFSNYMSHLCCRRGVGSFLIRVPAFSP
jgi:hypothetical protein